MDNDFHFIFQKAKRGDKEALLEIILRFNSLIKKYGNKLNYDGADTDLIIALIESIDFIPIEKKLKTDKEISPYMVAVIKNKYIKLSKKQDIINKMEIPLKEEILNDSYVRDIDLKIYL